MVENKNLNFLGAAFLINNFVTENKRPSPKTDIRNPP